MLYPKLPIAVMCLAMATACSKKVKNQTQGDYIAAVLSEDAVPASRTLPTRPEGGFVEGKGANLDPEEAEQRRNKNMVEPIVFGTSVAGITMNTRYSEAMQTLVYYSSNQSADFYQEHIAVIWGAGADPVPGLIVVLDGYAGKLKLPDPYGEVSIGQPMAGRIGSINDVRSFMLTIGAAFEGQPSTYDCEKSLTCQFNEDASSYQLDFRRGGVYLNKTADLPIGLIYFSQPQRFFAPLVDPILHNLSIGGLTFQTRRTTAEARLGPPVDERPEGGIVFTYYDRFNFAVAWGQDTTPSAFKAVGKYEGPQNFGGTIGSRKIGDSFANVTAPASDTTGKNLLLALDRALNQRAANYDCSIVNGEVQATCQATIVDDNPNDNIAPRLLLVIDRSVYSFTMDASRTWLSVGMREP
ncbi:MAG TPA: hypothetical protein VFO10_26795 [Oligoflexus sp.]|uniref:hypothetical protein n=1 Tax=Oligoflexus sp. TaxID=1971216 RepID=UPI002D7EC149|nr:hypothetical protein [Oligoflexus sp.]HET9240902.1 hypothetical protein [Oligoflexus sp.]